MLKITSSQNPKFKEALSLQERRARKESDQFLIEGYRELFRAIEAGRKVERIFFCPSLFLGENERALLLKAEAQTGSELIECTEELFRKLSYRDRPDGILAVAPQTHLTLAQIQLSEPPFLVIAESIEKPGNLGTILRSCDAAGVDAVLVADPTTDIHNPNVVRSSVGTLFTLPVLEVDGAEALRFLRARHIRIVAATPHAKLEYTEADLTQPLAIAVGTEQVGLSDEWMRAADLQVRIPMLGKADSLNVASATTILLYETVRQRRRPPLR